MYKIYIINLKTKINYSCYVRNINVHIHQILQYFTKKKLVYQCIKTTFSNEFKKKKIMLNYAKIFTKFSFM